MPAARRVSRSKPTPVTVRPSKLVPRRRNEDSSWSMTATSCPARSMARARDAPTRPQPMMTKCTIPTLHRGDGPGETVPEPVRGTGTSRHTVSVVSSPGRVVKRVLLGRAMRSDRLGETLLPKRLALPVFASDALSSVAYAPDEILLTLGLGGGALALTNSWKIALAVVVVMAVVIMSYRQNVHAYPSGGGDYEVASVNLGPKAGLTVASALLVDYVLTVAVSVSAGVQNAANAFDFVRGKEAVIAVAIVALLTAMNLRGVRESGTAFAIPTYLFMVTVIGMALVGFYRAGDRDPARRGERGAWSCCPSPVTRPSAGSPWPSSCCAPSRPGARRSPASRRSATACPRSASRRAGTPRRRCCSWARVAITMLLSMVALARWTGVKYAEDPATQLTRDGVPVGDTYVQDTVMGQVAHVGVLRVRARRRAGARSSTGLILILAANTAFNGFPVLGSILARTGSCLASCTPAATGSRSPTASSSWPLLPQG